MTKFRIEIYGGPGTQGWWWTLMRPRGRGRRVAKIYGPSKVHATEAECRASIDAFRKGVADAKIVRNRA